MVSLLFKKLLMRLFLSLPQVNPEPKSEEKAPSLLKINGLFNLKAPLIKINPPPSICSDGSPVSEIYLLMPYYELNVNKLINYKSQARNNDDGEIYIEGDNEEYVGQIHFSVEYDYQNTTLVLKILQGKELPAKDLSGTSDPYVKVTLLPDKKHRLETKIKRRTLNPRWNETFYFEGFSTQKLQSRVIMSVKKNSITLIILFSLFIYTSSITTDFLETILLVRFLCPYVR